MDPLSDKYPSMSPFMYCAGNPVRLIDPNGMEIEGIGDGIKNFFKGVGNVLSGRPWAAKHKTNLGNRQSTNDVMNARFREGNFIGWVSDSYLNNLSTRTDPTSQNLHSRITSELTYWSPAQSPFSYDSYADVVNHYASELSNTTSMKAPTVKKTGEATLTFAGLSPTYIFDIEKGRKQWTHSGSPSFGIVNFSFSHNSILSTNFSRLQPQFGNANTPPLGALTNINGRLYDPSIVATLFNYNLSVPVVR